MKQRKVNKSEPEEGLPRPAPPPQGLTAQAHHLEINQDIQTLLKGGDKSQLVFIGFSHKWKLLKPVC